MATVHDFKRMNSKIGMNSESEKWNDGKGAANIKSPEVVLSAFVSASSSL